MYELARPAIYSYSIQRGTPHVNLRQKRASLFNSQILVVALIGIFGGLKPKMCVHFSKDWRSGTSIIHRISAFQVHTIHLSASLLYSPNRWLSHTCSGISRYRNTAPTSPNLQNLQCPFSP